MAVKSRSFFRLYHYVKEYETVLKEHGVSFTPHGLNTVHIVPAGVDKQLAIQHLDDGDSRFLVFADGFYDTPDGQGNDLAFIDLPKDTVTCINVGCNRPKVGSGVFYFPHTSLQEWELRNHLLDKILKACSFADLNLVQI